MNKKAMYKLSYGLFVLTAKEGEKDNGCIINTAIQAASAPNQLSICVNKANYTHDMICRTGVFTVSVLAQNAGFELFKRFGFQSGRDTDKFAGFEKTVRGANGILYITEGTNAYISVKVEKTEDLGSHTMFIGEITDMDVLGETPSVTYDYYLNEIKPKPEAVSTTSDGQTVWRCKICGYEYVGEELPDDFICPLCKHPASDFEKVTSPTQGPLPR
jgi:flavin reductase (DIM6/NTAB) family NADH-FMN oxidoreductase RutF/rubredoxin